MKRIKKSGWSESMAKDPERFKEMKRQIQARAVATKQKIVDDYLASHPCIDCGESDLVVLEFDHVTTKRHGVREVIQGWGSIKRLATEMSACEIRCANCHKRRHAKERSRRAQTNTGAFELGPLAERKEG